MTVSPESGNPARNAAWRYPGYLLAYTFTAIPGAAAPVELVLRILTGACHSGLATR
ncbi:MAG TPA: hypothetical protein VFY29_14370 [Terriglobia bacterium]|nr:hypothetical protein [Terriglobia bacterium]